MTPHKTEIINDIYNSFMGFKEMPTDTIYIDKKARTLDMINTDWPTIKDEDVKPMLEQWVTESWNENGFIILYICPDNATITIEGREHIMEAKRYGWEKYPNYYYCKD